MAIRDGDIIGVTGSGLLSGIINLGTFALPGVGISHVGIVHKEGAQPFVFETTSIDRPPCYYQGRKIKGCQAHKLDDFLEFVDGKVWHYPLRCELYAHEIERLRIMLERDLGRPYDMLGAFRSGGLVFRALQAVMRPEDLNQLFCSEWDAALLAGIGRIRTRHHGSWNPNKLCRRLVWGGICDKPVRLK